MDKEEKITRQLDKEEYLEYIETWKIENKELIDIGKCRKIFLECLPKGGSGGIGYSQINWLNSLSYNVFFIYEDIQSCIQIIGYDKKKESLIIEYKNKKYNSSVGNFCSCNFAKILGKRTSEYRYDINEEFKDKKRHIIITDRKKVESPYKKGTYIKWYKCHCNICNYDEGWIEEISLKNGRTCNCCNGNIVVEGINDVPTVAPWMVKFFQGGYDEAKLYGKNGRGNINNKDGYIYPICPDCGRVKDKKMCIGTIYRTHSIGCICGDGISYPNKFAFSLLSQLNINFETEKKFNWCKYLYKNKIRTGKYDFYFKLNNKEYIIEMDGGLGHGKAVHKDSKFTSDETLEIDAIKNELAHKHNISIIRIDCIESNLKYIKQNILKSNLNTIFNLNKINWLEIENFALSNRVKEVCKLWGQGIHNTNDISNIAKISPTVVRVYLNKGKLIGWCDYDGKQIMKQNANNNRRKKPIFCITTNKIFESAKDCERQSIEIFGTKLCHANISSVCTGKTKFHKEYKFKFISDLTEEEYEKYNIEEKLKELSKTA